MIEEIDWNRMWIEATENASWRKRRGDMTEFWNKRSRRYSESLKHNDRSMQMISKLDIDPECTVLDIGAGPGTLTIPLARIVKHVTVVEPSSGMLACLRENAALEDGKVYIEASDIDSGPQLFIVVAYMAKWFYPELFEDLDPEATQREYLDRFQWIEYDVDEHGVFVYPPIEIDDGLAGIPDRYKE